MRKYVPILFLIGLFTFTMQSFANKSVSWKIIPEESSITFTGKQNNTPISGEFKHFRGQFSIDDKHLENSKGRLIIDTNSLATGYQDIEDALKASDWLNVKLFPEAIFDSLSFKRLGKDTYQVQGNIKIRKITLPLTIHFTLQELTKNKLRARGQTQIKRSIFEIGQGEWKDTNDIKDTIEIHFIITGIKE